jgi:hypothetical protein
VAELFLVEVSGNEHQPNQVDEGENNRCDQDMLDK